MALDRHLHNSHQAITFDILNRISTLTDQRLYDEVLHRFLRDSSGGALLVDTESGFMPPATGSGANLLVATGTGGDRSTGWGMKIQVGLGFRKMSSGEQPLADLPLFVPMFGDAEKTFTTQNSDGSLPRMDHVYMKPLYTDGNSSASINIIDPSPPNNITAETRDQNTAYDYDFSYEVGDPDAGAAGGTGAPPAPTGYVDNDLVCKILVLAGSGDLEDNEIVDQRTIFEMDQGLVPGVTSLAASAIVVDPTVEGQNDGQSALEALETGLATAIPTAINIGSFEYVAPGQVQIAPGVGDVVKIDIDGTVLTQGVVLNFDMATDIDGAAEGGTGRAPWYCYAYNVASVITAALTLIPPHDSGGAKPGYHPSRPTWKCVGMVMNDASENFIPFTNSNNVTTFTDFKGLLHSLVTGTALAQWALLALEMPETSPYALCTHFIRGTECWGLVGQSDAADTITNDQADYSDLVADIVHGLSTYRSAEFDDPESHVDEFVLPIADRANPGFKHAMLRSQSGPATFNLIAHQLVLRGWFDPWAPRITG